MVITKDAFTASSAKGLHHCAMLMSFVGATLTAPLYSQTYPHEKLNETSRVGKSIDDDTEQQKESPQKGQIRIVDAEREAEAALTKLGVKVTRNAAEKVVLVSVPEDSSVTDDDFALLGRLTWGKTRSPFTDQSGTHWVTPKLSIFGSAATEGALERVAGLTQLRFLNVIGSENINGLPELNGLTNLERLILHKNTNITNDGDRCETVISRKSPSSPVGGDDEQAGQEQDER